MKMSGLYVMKKLSKSILVFNLLLIGCGDPESDKNDQKEDSQLDAAMVELNESASDTLDAATNVSAQAEETFSALMTEKLTGIETKLDELTAKVQTLNEEAQSKSQAAIEQIKEKKASFSSALKEWKANPDKTQEKLKGEVSNALQVVEEAIEKLRRDLDPPKNTPSS